MEKLTTQELIECAPALEAQLRDRVEAFAPRTPKGEVLHSPLSHLLEMAADTIKALREQSEAHEKIVKQFDKEFLKDDNQDTIEAHLDRNS